MEIDQLQDYCLAKKGTTQEMPFDNETLVFKVMGKMFMLLGLERWERGEPSINVKCDPQKAIELREQYDGVVTSAWHMNKTHWNTIHLNQSMTDAEVLKWIDHSYALVVAGLTKKLQAQLNTI
ncbi:MULTISPECIES: MmcQ/YjbR family DNA-binding protein [Nonlabens]|uniref:MmcQ-like protein n=1 Tax=Nonlabens agnitus TaxID=870484 RepID=A0A2S9WX27_9FLAO|nr:MULTISPECIES: MmcQ/YjbR family DNA-binding protein [Nonlabens]KQC32636.1 MmcQ-like protein [Nonlabens sp. YIK11]PRP68028.1 MmcQ-like protein [Nonlabens agnitus]